MYYCYIACTRCVRPLYRSRELAWEDLCKCYHGVASGRVFFSDPPVFFLCYMSRVLEITCTVNYIASFFSGVLNVSSCADPDTYSVVGELVGGTYKNI